MEASMLSNSSFSLIDWLQYVDKCNSDLPDDLRIRTEMGRRLKEAHGNLTNEVLKKLMANFSLSEIYVKRWQNAYDQTINDYSKYSGVSLKMKQFVEHFKSENSAWILEQPSNDIVWRWAGGSEEEVLTGLVDWLQVEGCSSMRTILKYIDKCNQNLPEFSMDHAIGRKVSEARWNQITRPEIKAMGRELGLSDIELESWFIAHDQFAGMINDFGFPPMVLKMSQFYYQFGEDSSRLLEEYSEVVTQWAGGSDEEVKAALHHWEEQKKLMADGICPVDIIAFPPSSQPLLFDIANRITYCKRNAAHNKAPRIRREGTDYSIEELLVVIDQDYAIQPDALNLERSIEQQLEKLYNESALFIFADVADELNLNADTVKAWSSHRALRQYKNKLAQCSPVFEKMLKLWFRLRNHIFQVFEYCIESVSKWAGGSEEEARSALKYWYEFDEEVKEFNKTLSKIEILASELPKDLKLNEHIGETLLRMNKTKGHISTWSETLSTQLSQELGLSTLEIYRWTIAHKLEHYTKKFGQLTPVNTKMLHFATYLGNRSLIKTEDHMEMVCQWAGGSEEEVRASLFMFGGTAPRELSANEKK